MQLVEAQRKLTEAEKQLKSFRDRNLNGCYETSHAPPSYNEPIKVKTELIDEYPKGSTTNPSPNTLHDDVKVPHKISKTNENKENVGNLSDYHALPNFTPVHIKSESGNSSDICSKYNISGMLEQIRKLKLKSKCNSFKSGFWDFTEGFHMRI